MMDDATTFAALAALPARFQWRTERRSLPHADRLPGNTSVAWELMISLDNHGLMLHGQGATLAAAHADARAQLVAYQELL